MKFCPLGFLVALASARIGWRIYRAAMRRLDGCISGDEVVIRAALHVHPDYESGHVIEVKGWNVLLEGAA